MNRLMNYQDIHASDIDSWKSFREKYQSGDFAGAQAIAQTLTNTQISHKTDFSVQFHKNNKRFE